MMYKVNRLRMSHCRCKETFKDRGLLTFQWIGMQGCWCS